MSPHCFCGSLGRLVIGRHIPVMRAWGFKPTASGFVWVKIQADGSLCLGGGLTTRKNAEFCVLGKRGRSVRKAADVHEVILAPRREHSRKPDEVYRRIVKYAGECSRVDLFARESHDGFIPWGDETTKFTNCGRPASNSGRPH